MKSKVESSYQKLLSLNSNDIQSNEVSNSKLDELKRVFHNLLIEFQKQFPYKSLVFSTQQKNIIQQWNIVSIQFEDLKMDNEQIFQIFPEKQNIIISPFINQLGQECFSFSLFLRTIKFPSALQSFGNFCFYLCSSLTSVNLPSSLQFLGDSYFSWCSSLTSVNLPLSLQLLGNKCFSYCRSLILINFPSSLHTIGYSCFSRCSSLTSIKLPLSIHSLENECFSYCSSLTSINLPSSIQSLGNSCFSGCSSLTTINLPSSLQSLGNFCFSYCSSLTTVSFVSSFQSIGDFCFSYCSSLTLINFPSSLKTIGKNCFLGCSKLPPHIENQFLIEISKISNSVNSISGSISHKIKTLQRSKLRIPLKLYNEQLNEIQKWESIQIISQDFKIENNNISKLEQSKQIIILHPIIHSLSDSCFS
jgi:hypothetical protein